MKKTYYCPSVRIVRFQSTVIICASNGVSGHGIGYGGVDKEGTVNPESRRSTDWSDFESE